MSRPRIRTLKPEIWGNRGVGTCSRDARVLYVGLITMCDDEGRTLAEPSAILGHCFPYDKDAPKKVDKWLAELERVSLIYRYEVEQIAYVYMPGWQQHQKINRPTKSKLPAPPWGPELPEPPANQITTNSVSGT